METISFNQLRSSLAPTFGGKKPSYKVIKRAIEEGMPSVPDNLYGRTRFVLSDVIEWITKGGRISKKLNRPVE